MKAVSRVIENSNGFPAVFESTSTLQFQPEDTRIANSSGESTAQTIERIRLRLEAQGYVAAPN